ncbi:MAG: DMT family transporter [Nitrospirae bacterium]|nr:MAG: hypothetical protein D084_Lepto4C00384G0004 [Leptospirillum sp. Group IV 'UBA BS']MCL4486464.1 DMT family transporter [Nitrospirota bacterium]MCL5284890.1 DMT family transporter [Nitrospirota bacterium]
MDQPNTDSSLPGRRKRGTLAAWGLVLFWGFHYVVLYRPLRLIDPERYLFLRFGWAATVVLVLAFFLPFLRGISPGNWGRLLLLSLVGVVGYQWVFLRAVAILDPVPLVLILSLGPVLVALYSHIRGHESFSSFQWGMMLLIGAGISLVVRGEPARHAAHDAQRLGFLMAFLSLIFFTLSTLITRSLLSRMSMMQVTLAPILLGGALLVPVHPSWILPPRGAHAEIILLSLLYSIAIALFLCYFLWNVAIRDIGPSRAGLWSNGQPIVVAVGTALFLHRPLGLGQIVGGLVAVAGFWGFFGLEMKRVVPEPEQET